MNFQTMDHYIVLRLVYDHAPVDVQFKISTLCKETRSWHVPSKLMFSVDDWCDTKISSAVTWLQKHCGQLEDVHLQVSEDYTIDQTFALISNVVFAGKSLRKVYINTACTDHTVLTQQLCTLSNLEDLYIAGGYNYGYIDQLCEDLGALTKLTCLQFSDVLHEDVGIGYLSRLTNLQCLLVVGIEKQLTIRDISPLTALRHLLMLCPDVDYDSVIDIDAVSTLTNLTFLSLDSASDSEGVDALKSLTQLRTMSLSTRNPGLDFSDMTQMQDPTDLNILLGNGTRFPHMRRLGLLDTVTVGFRIPRLETLEVTYNVLAATGRILLERYRNPPASIQAGHLFVFGGISGADWSFDAEAVRAALTAVDPQHITLYYEAPKEFHAEAAAQWFAIAHKIPITLSTTESDSAVMDMSYIV